MNTQEFLILSVTIFASSFVHGLAGFAFGMISMSIIPLFMGIDFATVFVALLALLINIILVWQLRGSVDIRRISVFSIGAVVGIPIGVYLLRTLDPGVIKKVLGSVLISFSTYSLARRGEPRFIIPTWCAVPMGLISGILNGMINMGGAPLVIYSHYKGWKKEEIKATFVMYFTIMLIYKIAIFAGTGMISVRMLKHTAMITPFMCIGAGLGVLVFGRISREIMRKITFVLLLTLGILLILKS